MTGVVQSPHAKYQFREASQVNNTGTITAAPATVETLPQVTELSNLAMESQTLAPQHHLPSDCQQRQGRAEAGTPDACSDTKAFSIVIFHANLSPRAVPPKEVSPQAMALLRELPDHRTCGQVLWSIRGLEQTMAANTIWWNQLSGVSSALENHVPSGEVFAGKCLESGAKHGDCIAGNPRTRWPNYSLCRELGLGFERSGAFNRLSAVAWL